MSLLTAAAVFYACACLIAWCCCVVASRSDNALQRLRGHQATKKRHSIWDCYFSERTATESSRHATIVRHLLRPSLQEPIEETTTEANDHGVRVDHLN